ncbi:restriction endonuclease subunit S domain-containing protein [Mycoplasma parvum]|uniref:Type I restriction modification DNA specificity domain-containing protein n=1 Tax=Mycoplasma parvum str. Indiana TaxID=1403316 RepID=U5ND54_9MOLU|nr:hypothetical protein [Mycoplasma parvum]AGX89270.1 hypothetical protein PRV_02710 [Mycoplasma parvum str. Indiana]
MLLEFLNYLLPKKYKETTAKTSLKHLSPFVLKNLEILIPDQKILEKFNNFWKDIHSKIEKLEQKIEEQRDKILFINASLLKIKN